MILNRLPHNVHLKPLVYTMIYYMPNSHWVHCILQIVVELFQNTNIELDHKMTLKSVPMSTIYKVCLNSKKNKYELLRSCRHKIWCSCTRCPLKCKPLSAHKIIKAFYFQHRHKCVMFFFERP